jgi:polygalacturonase
MSFIVCLILTEIVCSSAYGQNVFKVKDYGAVGDGAHLDTPAINKAIDAAANTGGGTVLLPAGTYLSGSIHLKSNIQSRPGRFTGLI